MVGRDSVITHISGRLIPAVFLTLAYPVLLARAIIGLLNAASGQIGTQAAVATLVEFPQVSTVALSIPYMVLCVFLIYYALRLLLRRSVNGRYRVARRSACTSSRTG